MEWSEARVRRRFGELDPGVGRCGRPRSNNNPCNMGRLRVGVDTIERIATKNIEQWELGGCRHHLTEAERDFKTMVERTTRFEDGVIRISGARVLDEMDRLESGELERHTRPPVPRLPACWQRMREDIEQQAEGAVKRPRAETLRDLWEWQQELCAVCGRYGVTDLDHDHWSGLVRGFLCRSCNGAGVEDGEGLFWPVQADSWSRYRQLNPARWLRLRMTYAQGVAEQQRGLIDPPDAAG